MELKYDIYMLNNAQGTGEKRQYIRIVRKRLRVYTLHNSKKSSNS